MIWHLNDLMEPNTLRNSEIKIIKNQKEINHW